MDLAQGHTASKGDMGLRLTAFTSPNCYPKKKRSGVLWDRRLSWMLDIFLLIQCNFLLRNPKSARQDLGRANTRTQIFGTYTT